MRQSRFFIFMTACFLAGIGFISAVNAAGLQLKDIREIVTLSDPQISPDGKSVAVTVSRWDWKKDKSKSEIYLVNTMSGDLRELTYDREGIAAPHWSPAGKRLAFIAKDAGSKKGQVYVMPMNGGDAHRITTAKQGVDEFAWSPDGTRIAYITQDNPPDEKALKHHEDGFQVTDNNYTARAAVMPWHLWVVNSNGGKPKRLTRGSWSLNNDQGTVQGAATSPLAWRHDGKAIVFTKFPGVYYGTAWQSTLAEVNLADGSVHTIVKDEGSVFPRYAPRSSILAFMRPRDGDQNNGTAVYVSTKGRQFDATHMLAHNINDYSWEPDGSALLLVADQGTRSIIWHQPLRGRATRLDLGKVNPGSGLSVSRHGAIAFIGTTASHPDELYYMSSSRTRPRRLTSLNAFVDKLRLGRTTGISWTGPGGFREDGVLTYPADYRKGLRYPLVLLVHGGPEGASTVRFDTLRQLLASHGFMVFQPNYRGSINLGDAYQHAIYRDTGEGPGKDVMAGLAAVEKLGDVDAQRIGVSGWSYGGYMTAWMIGHYPAVWKAAVSGAALTDWVMDYDISFYQTGDLYFFGGSPYEKGFGDIWRNQSPIKYAVKTTAPTLIMGDAGDPNVPIVNSYELYHALRDNGVTTEFYVYPSNSHFPHASIVRTTDIYRRWIAWMEKYLH